MSADMSNTRYRLLPVMCKQVFLALATNDSALGIFYILCLGLAVTVPFSLLLLLVDLQDLFFDLCRLIFVQLPNLFSNISDRHSAFDMQLDMWLEVNLGIDFTWLPSTGLRFQ